MNSTVLTALLIASAVPGLASAQGSARVCVFRGASGAVGDLRVLDPGGAQAPEAPAGLQGIRLLDLEVNGRTDLTRFLPGSTRLVRDVPGAARALLPAGAGSLYRFARPEAAGGSSFGFFVVEPSGAPRVVFELAGVGAAGDEDPWLANVAVSADGSTLLAATRPGAGGDLWEIDLASGGGSSRTASAPPLAFAPESLMLGSGLGAAATARGLWRFVPGGPAEASLLPFPQAQPIWFGREVALAAHGPYGALVAGDGPLVAHVWRFGPTGPAEQVSAQPSEVSRAGYLPDVAYGPFLAVSDDGSRVAWRREGLTREAFLAAPLAAAQPLQVTADAFYLDMLDEIGQFLFVPFTNRLVIAVGEQGPGPAIENLDLYSVELASGGGTVFANLSATSGDTSAPFLAPSTLKPEDLFVDPALSKAVIVDRDSGSGTLRALDLASGVLQDLIVGARGPTEAAWIGADLAISLRHEGTSSRRQVWVFPQGGPVGASLLRDVSDLWTVQLLTPRGDQEVAWIETRPNAEQHLWRWERSSGLLRELTPRALVYGPTLAFAQSGALVLGVGPLDGPTVLVAWPPAGPPRRLPGGAPSFLLPSL